MLETASSLIAVNVITHYFGKLPVVAAAQQLWGFLLFMQMHTFLKGFLHMCRCYDCQSLLTISAGKKVFKGTKSQYLDEIFTMGDLHLVPLPKKADLCLRSVLLPLLLFPSFFKDTDQFIFIRCHWKFTDLYIFTMTQVPTRSNYSCALLCTYNICCFLSSLPFTKGTWQLWRCLLLLAIHLQSVLLLSMNWEVNPVKSTHEWFVFVLESMRNIKMKTLNIFKSIGHVCMHIFFS